MTNSNGKRIGLAVFDVDGTLRSFARGMLPSATEALRHVASLGVPIAIATGRNFAELPEEIINAADIRFCIGINGNRVTDIQTGEVLADHRIPRDTALKVLEIVKRYKSGYCVYDGERDILDPESLENWEYWKSVSAEYLWIPDDVVPDIVEYVAGTNGVSKICGFVHGNEAFLPMWDEVEALPGVAVTSAVDFEVEAVPEGVSKATALLELCEAEGIDPENVFCMGDGENDACMLEVSGISVAMGNACEATKKAARYITDSCDEDGVYKAVMRFFC